MLYRSKIFSLSWNLVPKLIWISRIQWWCSFYIFGQFLSKNQNYEFKLKFFTKSNLNMQNSVIFLSLFFCLWSEIYSFWVNLVEKVKIVSFSWNLMLRLIRRCRIQWCYSLFSVIDWKYRFCPILVSKFKIIFQREIWYLESFTKCLILTLVFMSNRAPTTRKI